MWGYFEGGFTVSIRGLSIGGLALVVSMVFLGAFALPAFAAAPEAPVSGEAKPVTATTATLTGGVLNPGAPGEEGEYEYLFQQSASECASGSAVPGSQGVALGSEKEAVPAVQLTGLAPGAPYTFCLVERNAAEEAAYGLAVTFTTPAVAPVVSETYVTQVSADGATLGAQIDPGGAATTYHFEYGTSTAYGHATAESGSVGADDEGHEVGAHVQGLEAGTVYHYRVVASNSVAPDGIAGADHTFTTQSQASVQALPDGRSYELVTPAEQGDGALYGPGERSSNGFYQASESGDGLAYFSLSPFPGAQTGGVNSYIATRDGGGWSSQAITPPQAPASQSFNTPSLVAYSSDLSRSVLLDGGGNLGQDDPPLVPGEPPHNQNLFLRDSLGSYQLLDLTPASVTPEQAQYDGTSPDLSHIVFSSYAALTGSPVAAGAGGLYEWSGGSLELVSEVPAGLTAECGGSASPCGPVPSTPSLGLPRADSQYPAGALDAVSSDGSRVLFAAALERENSQVDPYRLYMHEAGGRTVSVSASQKTNGAGPGGTDPLGPGRAYYQGASADESRVFFTSCEQLTNDSTATITAAGRECRSEEGDFSANGSRSDLYLFDAQSGRLTDITVDTTDPEGADVRSVLGVSADGAYVYFIANGVLASGASRGNCEEALSEGKRGGTCNLYVWHDDETRFIAGLDQADASNWNEHLTSRVSPDGTHLVFESIRSLTGYDNNRVIPGSCGNDLNGDPLPRACDEVFLYSAVPGQLVCVSCNQTGARPTGPSTLPPIEREEGAHTYLPRSLSADGSRVFFESSDALVPGDVNGARNVYEYENGRQYLISDGGVEGDSSFVDASPSGDDVFFETHEGLTGQDTGGKADIYDARIDGGFPSEVSPVPCAGETCRAPSPLGSGVMAPASVGLAGAGNLAPPPAAAIVGARSLTRAQRLTQALRACRRLPKRKRTACVTRARRLYGPISQARRSSVKHSSGRGTK